MKNEILTQKILSRVKTKRVKEKSIHYAVRGLRELMSEFESDTTIPQIKEDAITILGENVRRNSANFRNIAYWAFQITRKMFLLCFLMNPVRRAMDQPTKRQPKMQQKII